jgi:hypothetical protein
MKSELVAERTVELPMGPVRLTLARHDDGHYSGVAALVRTGQRIGMLASGAAQPHYSMVDAAVAGPEVIVELERLLAMAMDSEPGRAPVTTVSGSPESVNVAI